MYFSSHVFNLIFEEVLFQHLEKKQLFCSREVNISLVTHFSCRTFVLEICKLFKVYVKTTVRLVFFFKISCFWTFWVMFKKAKKKLFLGWDVVSWNESKGIVFFFVRPRYKSFTYDFWWKFMFFFQGCWKRNRASNEGRLLWEEEDRAVSVFTWITFGKQSSSFQFFPCLLRNGFTVFSEKMKWSVLNFLLKFQKKEVQNSSRVPLLPFPSHSASVKARFVVTWTFTWNLSPPRPSKS